MKITKIIRSFLVIYFCFSAAVFAQENANNNSKNNRHNNQNSSTNNCQACPACNCGVGGYYSVPSTELIASNGVIVTLYNAQGMYYVNNTPIGPIANKSIRDGIYYINNLPITEYTASPNLAPSSYETSPFYFEAYAKFTFGDFEGAAKDCETALKFNPQNASAIKLNKVIQAILAGKIDRKDAKNYSAAKIAQMADSIKN